MVLFDNMTWVPVVIASPVNGTFVDQTKGMPPSPRLVQWVK